MGKYKVVVWKTRRKREIISEWGTETAAIAEKNKIAKNWIAEGSGTVQPINYYRTVWTSRNKREKRAVYVTQK